ncbi:MAG: DegQ family serine endoprotease [Acidobacteriota bacterium]|jgi:serine protease Do
MNTQTTNTRKAPRRRVWLGVTLLAAAAALGIWHFAPELTAEASVKPEPLASNIEATVPVALPDLIDAVKPAVVNISASGSLQGAGHPEVPFPEGTPFDEFFRRFFDPHAGATPAPPLRREAMGSGFIVDPDGYVVTNHHVIDSADEITVTLQDGKQFEAKLLGSDQKTDLALLKIESKEPLPYVRLGDSDTTRVGDWVVAIGNPFGFGGTATTGIVSARGRDIQSGPYDDFLQIDAPINRGNSGGPLFNLAGEVIGINSAIVSPNGGNVGIGFAIPATQAKPILDELRHTGHIERAWLGVRIQEVTPDLAEGLGLEEGHGALVVSVDPDSPAAEAGIKPGDVIVRFNGEEVSRAKSLARMVGDEDAGTKADVEVWREGDEHDMKVALAASPDDATVVRASMSPEHNPAGKLGLSLAALSDNARRQFGVPDDVHGALVIGVEPDSPAARRGLQPGDVVVMVGQTPVDGPREAAAEMAKVSDAGRETVVLEVARSGDLMFVPLRLA